MSQETKYCKFCGQVIDADCVICPKCGKQVEEIKYSRPDNIIIKTTITLHHLLQHRQCLGMQVM